MLKTYQANAHAMNKTAFVTKVQLKRYQQNDLLQPQNCVVLLHFYTVCYVHFKLYAFFT